MRLFERVLANRSVVNVFFAEAAELVDAIAGGNVTDMVELKRMLHTLKGNSAICDLETVTALCHELETQIADERTYPAVAELAKLRARWSAVAANLERLLGTRRGVIEIDEPQLAALEAAVRRGASTMSVLTMIRALKLEATHGHLGHFATQARGIAARLGKTVDVRIEGGDARVDPRHWARFWSAFHHAVRNAVDHGLESSDERVSNGKSPTGVVTLRTLVRDERFVVEIADDGRGMDWEALARKAEALGIAAATPTEIQAALFKQGVSTAAEVSDLSGRGTGLGAVQAATQRLGGRLEIQTTHGRGTTFSMSFPSEAMSPEPIPAPPPVSAIATLGAC
jgi:two-component system chemotaxis sensor kinase CheA